MIPIRRLLTHPAVDVPLRLAAMGAVVMVAVLTTGIWRNSGCQAEYNRVTNERSRILTDSADQERMAQRKADDAMYDFVLALATNAAPDVRAAKFTALYKALGDQQRERAEADKARADHPLPPPPDQTCG